MNIILWLDILKATLQNILESIETLEKAIKLGEKLNVN